MNFLVVEGDFPFWRAFVLKQWQRQPHRTLLLTQTPKLWPHADYDLVEEMPVTNGQLDADRLRRIVDGFGPVAGALTLFEPSVGLALRIQRVLGLPQLARGEPRTLRNKAAMAEALRSTGLAAPDTVHGLEPAPLVDQALARLDFPMIVKPTELAGSAGVSLVRDAAALELAVRSAFEETLPFEVDGALTSVVEAFGCERGVVVQEYVDGPEYSVEGYASLGRIHALAVTEKIHTGPPLFEELGHLQPARISEGDAEAIRHYAVQAAEAFQLENCWFHLELRLSAKGPVMLEINCRLSGDMIARLLELRSDLNAGASLLRLAAGESAPPPERWVGAAGVRMVTADRGGTIGSVRAPLLLSDAEFAVFESGPGAKVHAPRPGGVTRLGYTIVAGETADAVDERLRELAAETELEWAADEA